MKLKSVEILVIDLCRLSLVHRHACRCNVAIHIDYGLRLTEQISPYELGLVSLKTETM